MMLLPSVYGQVAVSYLDLSENMLQREWTGYDGTEKRRDMEEGLWVV